MLRSGLASTPATMASAIPGGYLVTGPSEGLYDMLEPLERLDAFLYRKPAGRPGSEDA